MDFHTSLEVVSGYFLPLPINFENAAKSHPIRDSAEPGFAPSYAGGDARTTAGLETGATGISAAKIDVSMEISGFQPEMPSFPTYLKRATTPTWHRERCLRRQGT